MVKKNKRWLWSGRIRAQCQRSWSDAKHRVNHFSPGILAWRLGDRSADTFEPLWQMIRGWQSFFYVTDGWLVYPRFINDAEAPLPSRALDGANAPASRRDFACFAGCTICPKGFPKGYIEVYTTRVQCP